MEVTSILESGLKQVHKICSKCNEGQMWPNGVIHSGDPTLFEHRCVNCEHIESYERIYPYAIL